MAQTTPKSMPDFDSEESELSNLLSHPRESCPPLDVLLAYDEDVLPAEHKEALRLHLVTCRLCPLLLADFATLSEPQLSAAQMERIRSTLPTQSEHAKSQHAKPSTRLYALIGIAAALLLATFVIFGLHSRSVPPPTIASIAPPPEPVAALEIPISPLEPPQGMLTRGGESGGDPAIDKLMPAFGAYNSGNYAAAAERFARLQATYPHSETVLLYLGVTQLFLHQDAKAYANLTSVQRPQPASVDALHWYTAVAAERMHAADAPQLFADICARKASRWSIQSCNIESQLH